MTGLARWWSEMAAAIADHVPGGIAGLFVLLVLLALFVMAARAWWRTWLTLPGRLLAWRPRWRRRKTKPEVLDVPEAAPKPEQAASDEVPEVPAAVLLSLADQYAASGRYAEAIRERLRGMVRRLVERGVIEHQPGWTVTEFAAAAGTRQPQSAPSLREASSIFSDVWYGGRDATAAMDQRMRALGEQL